MISFEMIMGIRLENICNGSQKAPNFFWSPHIFYTNVLHKSFILFAAHWSRDDALRNMILFLFSPVPLEILKLSDSVSAT